MLANEIHLEWREDDAGYTPQRDGFARGMVDDQERKAARRGTTPPPFKSSRLPTKHRPIHFRLSPNAALFFHPDEIFAFPFSPEYSTPLFPIRYDYRRSCSHIRIRSRNLRWQWRKSHLKLVQISHNHRFNFNPPFDSLS